MFIFIHMEVENVRWLHYFPFEHHPFKSLPQSTSVSKVQITLFAQLISCLTGGL